MQLLKKTNEKGNFAVLGQAGIGLLVFVIIIGVGALVLGQFRATGGTILLSDNTSFLGIVDDGISGIELFGDFTELIALVIIASVILGLLVFFRGGRR